VLAWLAHAYTALGAGTALGAVLALEAGDVRGAFLWLVVATVIDATDGVLARALRVKERLPWFDGATLDNVVDYLTYVFVPALVVVKTGLVPPALALPIGAESDRVCRRALSERGWSPWPDRASIPSSFASAPYASCTSMRMSTRHSGRRFVPLPRSWIARRRSCGAGCARPSAIRASGPVSRRASASG